MEDQSKFCTVPEAAEKFGVDRKTMYRWVKSGKIPSLVTPGGHHRILCSEIDSILEKNIFSKETPPRKKKILVVDDDEAVRKTMQNQLLRNNFIVETAKDGFQAGLKAGEMNPDLIVLDLMMEGIDGFEVCRTIKADRSLRHTKIIVLTGFGTPENREMALRQGADDFLNKRSPFKNILNRINALLTP